MPKCFDIEGYTVYFWSNESYPLEPVHVHISKGRRGPNTTKVWILSDGTVELENNLSRINENDLKKILRAVESYSSEIVGLWESYFKTTATFKE